MKCRFELTYVYDLLTYLKTIRAKVVMFCIKPKLMKWRFQLTYFYDLLTYLKTIRAKVVMFGIKPKIDQGDTPLVLPPPFGLPSCKNVPKLERWNLKACKMRTSAVLQCLASARPHDIGTHLKGIVTSFQVVLLFLKSFHFWEFYHFLKCSQNTFSL
jgi:hypothetical protein